MISQARTWGAMPAALRMSSAARREKFPAAMTPTPASVARRSISSKSSAVSPLEPTTTAVFRARAARTFSLTAAASV